ncbi:MAG: insulinase family protein, partial [Clostridiales bacterium]|nr:insulinase family protein [Clostridiales bacterium]
RLFQRIREDLGMAYSVYTGPAAYPGCGDYTIYAATTPKHAQKVLEQIDVEMNKLLQGGVMEKEFIQAKAQLKGSFILSLESAFNRMNNAGSNMIMLRRVIDPEETIRGIESVTVEDVNAAVHDLVHAPRCIAVVGKNARRYLPALR